MTKVLFICSANKWRSPTAEHIFADWPGIETDSAGLALLLEWITWANHTVREIRFIGTPEKIDAIAKTTEVADLLKRGERWAGFIEAPTE